LNFPDRCVALQQPGRLVFGPGCAGGFAEALLAAGPRRPLAIATTPVLPLLEPIREALERGGAKLEIWDGVNQEPTIATYEAAMGAANDARADAVIGFGGGSALDVAKLVAAGIGSSQPIREKIGIGNVDGRKTFLACLPTTAGTGSEASPNAILLDENDQAKKGVISPHLVPDLVFVDPELTRSVPPALTGATGIDALSHCLEAYANRLAHPLVDPFALEGVRLIAAHLQRAVRDGSDLEARAAVALGSLYGGMCLGPVNTGAVHALAYPLGGEFHVPHGVSIALLLPYVVEFNLPAAPERYAQLAIAMGAEADGDTAATAARAVPLLQGLVRDCGVPARLSEVGVTEAHLERMVESGMKVTRLLERNPREVTAADALAIYRRAL
jgi:alcohol dehydrogenase class IV